MSTTSTQRTILTGIGIGIVAGVVVGLIGGLLNLPMGIRGGLIGAFVVVGLRAMQLRWAKSDAPKV